MEPRLEAALLLWIPALLLVLAVLNLLGRGQRWWGLVALVCAVLVLVSPLTVSGSDSTAAVLLLWEAIIVTAPLLVGLILLVFTGDVAVGRLPAWARPLGVALVGLSAWLLYSWDPIHASEAAWERYCTSLLAGILSTNATLAALHVGFVPRRRSSTWPLFGGALCAGMLLALRGVKADVAVVMVPELVGLLLGAGLALLVVLLVVWSFERRLPDAPVLPPPSDEDLARAAEIIARRPRGVLQDE